MATVHVLSPHPRTQAPRPSEGLRPVPQLAVLRDGATPRHDFFGAAVIVAAELVFVAAVLFATL